MGHYLPLVWLIFPFSPGRDYEFRNPRLDCLLCSSLNIPVLRKNFLQPPQAGPRLWLPNSPSPGADRGRGQGVTLRRPGCGPAPGEPEVSGLCESTGESGLWRTYGDPVALSGRGSCGWDGQPQRAVEAAPGTGRKRPSHRASACGFELVGAEQARLSCHASASEASSG